MTGDALWSISAVPSKTTGGQTYLVIRHTLGSVRRKGSPSPLVITRDPFRVVGGGAKISNFVELDWGNESSHNAVLLNR
jgi:hypothetical protein